MRKKVCVLTGAGMSAESGIKTFRDADGLWEGHDVMKVASPQGWNDDIDLVLDFYNQRRAQLVQVSPNQGHLDLVSLEESFDTTIITQNVDDLHERAGSNKIIHLHGELFKIRSEGKPEYIIEWTTALQRGQLCPFGYQLRPHIVWFGEEVPMLSKAIDEIKCADAIIIIGTSMQVYPAASLTSFAPSDIPIIYVDPNPSINYELSLSKNLKILKGKATEQTKKAIDLIKTHRF